jgi:HD-like signal output (HDOD) protein
VWRSLGASWFTRALADKSGLEVAAFAFTIGVLSTTGQFVLLYNRPQEVVALWKAEDTGAPPLAQMERITLGVDHAEVAGLAAAHWGLPAPIVDVLGGYLTPERVPAPLTVLALSLRVALAATDQLCQRGAFSDDPVFDAPPALGQLAALTGTAPEALHEAIVSERDDALIFMQAIAGA